jgi:hypothetical protein
MVVLEIDISERSVLEVAPRKQLLPRQVCLLWEEGSAKDN